MEGGLEGGLEGRDLDVAALICDALADPTVTWSLGGFGALATFARRRGEPVAWLGDGRLGLTTERGGIAFRPGGIRPVAYETAFGRLWSQTVALCLPAETVREPLRVLTELGPDVDALRPRDRGAILFDAGIGLPQASLCFRTSDLRAIDALRGDCGAPVSLDELRAPTLPLDRVAIAPRGRIEVFGDGPDAGSDPPCIVADAKVLRSRRTHAATAPIPGGFVPFAHLYPPHVGGQDRSENGGTPCASVRHEAFQAVLRFWGDPGLLALKSALQHGEPLPADAGRHGRMVAKVVAAQFSGPTRKSP